MSSNLCSSSCTMSQNQCKTTARVDEVEFYWTIDNFDFHEAKGTVLRSSKFSSPTNDEYKWRLVCCPNGDSKDDEDYISIYLYLITKIRKPVYVKYSISPLTQLKMKMNRNTLPDDDENEVRKFTPSCRNDGWRKFMFKNIKFRDELSLNNNALTFHCSLKFSKMKNVDVGYHQCSQKISSCSISEDLALVFDQQKFSDVILTVEGKNYQAHKVILAARSPVFNAMFSHYTTEAEMNRVIIEDMNEDVMDEMMRYIYTGKCQNLNKVADRLLVAAEKYALDGLKQNCVVELCNTLSVRNAIDLLVLADLHSAKDLKIEAIKFIAAKFVEIVNEAAWKTLMSSNLELANEVCQAIARR